MEKKHKEFSTIKACCDEYSEFVSSEGYISDTRKISIYERETIDDFEKIKEAYYSELF